MFLLENNSWKVAAHRLALAFFGATLIFTIAGCANAPKTEAKYPGTEDRDELSNPNDIYSKPQTIFDGIHLFGSGKNGGDGGSSAIGVNSFLWRASLDTVAFMPLASADPFGGVILTDWYSAADTPKDRYKLNVFILDKQLRSDAIQVKVFKQTLQRNGTWHDVAVPPDMGPKIEDAILTRARQMRVAQMGNN